MPTAWIDHCRSLPLPGQFLIACLLQFAIYASLAGGVSILYGTLRRLGHGELIDPRPLRPGQIRTEIAWSLLTCLVYAAFTVAGLHLAASATPASWSDGFLRLALILLWYDFLTYWSHRLFHTRPLRGLHAVHHRSIRATPWSVYCIHPLEATVNQLQIILFLLLWPTGVVTLIALQFCIMYGGAIGHSNFDPFGRAPRLARLKALQRFHQRHHSLGRDHFGFAGPHWDIVFGTAGKS
ncbi:MAG: sterol desaturase family protein [Nevskia sp.]|nr:sterol desaturase family protein [Nevskia sp.]